MYFGFVHFSICSLFSFLYIFPSFFLCYLWFPSWLFQLYVPTSPEIYFSFIPFFVDVSFTGIFLALCFQFSESYLNLLSDLALVGPHVLQILSWSPSFYFTDILKLCSYIGRQCIMADMCIIIHIDNNGPISTYLQLLFLNYKTEQTKGTSPSMNPSSKHLLHWCILYVAVCRMSLLG